MLVFVPHGNLTGIFVAEAAGAWSPGDRGSVGGRETFGDESSGGNLIEAPFMPVLQIIL